ncbi:hypothetical protein HU200_039662 [Digitaria exilis]|uniref:Uncharacterized protein n=1 Tax=Digitaria exilis TaxID=1010633 RepID=A0A835EJF6_9POAL|nr:hypothetical protein HU200_039662 [Digitaria exilis]
MKVALAHGVAPGDTRGTTAATPGSAASPSPTTGSSTAASASSTTGTARPSPASDMEEPAAITSLRHVQQRILLNLNGALVCWLDVPSTLPTRADQLSFPDEYLTAVSGHYSPIAPGGLPMIRSLA